MGKWLAFKNVPEEVQQNIEMTENEINHVNENIEIKTDCDIPILDKVERYGTCFIIYD